VIERSLGAGWRLAAGGWLLAFWLICLRMSV